MINSGVFVSPKDNKVSENTYKKDKGVLLAVSEGLKKISFPRKGKEHSIAHVTIMNIPPPWLQNGMHLTKQPLQSLMKKFNPHLPENFSWRILIL